MVSVRQQRLGLRAFGTDGKTSAKQWPQDECKCVASIDVAGRENMLGGAKTRVIGWFVTSYIFQQAIYMLKFLEK